MYEVFNFVSARGEDFVDGFICSLNNKTAKGRIEARISYLKHFGPLAKFPAVEYLGGKIYYIRLSFGRQEIRIFYFFDGKDIVLTHGFLKKTPKAPPGEIARAHAICKEHFS